MSAAAKTGGYPKVGEFHPGTARHEILRLNHRRKKFALWSLTKIEKAIARLLLRVRGHVIKECAYICSSGQDFVDDLKYVRMTTESLGREMFLSVIRRLMCENDLLPERLRFIKLLKKGGFQSPACL